MKKRETKIIKTKIMEAVQEHNTPLYVLHELLDCFAMLDYGKNYHTICKDTADFFKQFNFLEVRAQGIYFVIQLKR